MMIGSKAFADKKKAGRATSLLLDESTLKSNGLFDGRSAFIPTLTFLSGMALGKELPLIQDQVTMGRGEESDIVIMDPAVSRKHIRLSCRKLLDRSGAQTFKVVLQDLDSKNGTLVNYRRVRRIVLKPGDKICLGKVILRFECKDLADQKFYEEIYRLATTDNLTSVLNKAAIMRVLSEELDKKLRYRRNLSILLIDIDGFKSLNDTRGHLAGDRALQSVARVIRRNLRKQDRVGRFGGEEFLAVLPETGFKGAATLAERIRREVEKSVAADLDLEFPVTASIGVAAHPLNGGTSENLIDLADRALYRAKGRGRNRVELWKEE